MSPTVRPVRWVLVVGAVLLVGVVVAGAALLAHQHGIRKGAAATAARISAAEDRLAAVEADEATALDARARADADAAEQRRTREEAEARIAELTTQLHAPAPLPVRARRVVAQLPDAKASDVATTTRSGRAGVWVAEPQFLLLEEALTLRPELERALGAAKLEVAALEVRNDAQVTLTGLVEVKASIWRDAALEPQTTTTCPDAPLVPGWALGAGGVVVGSILGGVVGRATAPGVTVVR